MSSQLDSRLHSCNWDDLGDEDRLAIWHAYEPDLFRRGYHIMGSVSYETLGKGDDNIPPAALDPFHPTDTEKIVHLFWPPKDLLSARSSTSWQPVRTLPLLVYSHDTDNLAGHRNMFRNR